MNIGSKIKTIIIDDEQLAITRIKNLLVDYEQFQIVGEAENGDDAISLIKTKRPDCIFLDISLPSLDGFQIIELADADWEPIIVVVSGSEKHALKAFDYYAFDYLLKPFRDSRFDQTIEKIQDSFSKSKQGGKSPVPKKGSASTPGNMIPIKSNGKIQFIKIDDIIYVVASGYYIEIYLKEKKHLLRMSMATILQKLDRSKFIRIHRSVIINLQFMQEILRSHNKSTSIKMKNGKIFKVSKSYKKELFERLHL